MDITDETLDTVEEIADKEGVKRKADLGDSSGITMNDVQNERTDTTDNKDTSINEDNNGVDKFELKSEKQQSSEIEHSSLTNITKPNNTELSTSEALYSKAFTKDDSDCNPTNIDLSLLDNIYSQKRTFYEKWKSADIVTDMGIEVMKLIHQNVRNEEEINSSILAHFVNALITASIQDSANFLNLARNRSKEDFRYLHPVNVAIYSIAIGRKLEYDTKRLLMLGASALFHDIGEIKLPDRIVSKSSRYTEIEKATMQKHPELGYMIVKKYAINAPKGLLLGVLQHHERIDGSGYPAGHMDKFIHPFAKIIAVSEAFDSMVTDRYHSEAINQIDALKVLYSKAGSKFDKRVVDLFISLLGMYPVGAVVKFKTDEEAIVVLRGVEDISKPTLFVIKSSDSTKVTPYILELSEDKETKVTLEIVMGDESNDEFIDRYIKKYSDSL